MKESRFSDEQIHRAVALLYDDGKLVVDMPKPDLPNFSLPMRIVVGIIALWLVYYLLKVTGTI